MDFNDNPYAAPNGVASIQRGDRDASWYLHHVQKYYRRMGIAGLTYVGLLVIGTVIGQAIDESFQVEHILGMSVWFTLLTWLFVTMIRIGYVPPADFPSHYTTARWTGIIAGAMFLPILGFPALVSVCRLTRYNALVNTKPPEEAIATYPTSD